uniref:Anoctamin n=1 Tax=Petromyzon marinus TaxID=7757 RepID=A0AAJ7WU88_PETMA|nr:anoctamin-4-like [Petromyzon marinus]XP_032810008.1 anoctamin-4-like [Petromyzon marinus]
MSIRAVSRTWACSRRVRSDSSTSTSRWACIVAFTSDIIPRLLHHYDYSAGHGEGSPTVHRYTENSLSIFNISNFQERSRPDNLPSWFDPEIHTVYRYRGYRYPPDHPHAYSVTTLYWHILAAKLVFVIVVEHLIFFTKAFIAHVIPDTPSHVHACARRERFVVREILGRAELRRLRNSPASSSSSSSVSPMTADMGLLHRPPHADISLGGYTQRRQVLATAPQEQGSKEKTIWTWNLRCRTLLKRRAAMKCLCR